MIPSSSPGRTTVSRISFGGWTQTVFVAGCLSQLSPDLDFWSDASDVGWGAHLGHVSGLWSQEVASLSINAQELLAVERGLLHFRSSVSHSTVASFADNSTAMAYLHNAGGTHSPALNSIAQRILQCSELHHVRLVTQFIMGRHNVLADSLSRPEQIQGSKWTLHMEVFLELHRPWPVMVNLFATSANHRCSIYFLPFQDPQVMGTDFLLQSWDHLQAYTFPPWAILPQVLHKLRSSSGVVLTLIAPYWPQRPWFPDLLNLAVALPIALPLRPNLLSQPRPRHRCLHRLRLHAWRDSSDFPGLRDSPPA